MVSCKKQRSVPLGQASSKSLISYALTCTAGPSGRGGSAMSLAELEARQDPTAELAELLRERRCGPSGGGHYLHWAPCLGSVLWHAHVMQCMTFL